MTESLDPYRFGDMPKHRFDCTQALTVYVSSSYTVDLAFHPLNQASLLLFGDAELNIDLSGGSLLWVSQASVFEATVGTIFLIGLELHEEMMPDAGSLGLEPHGMARRTATGLIAGIDLEICLGEVGLLFALSHFFKIFFRIT